MSTAADRLRAKAERMRSANDDGNPVSEATSRVRTTPVRVTVDLAPDEHAALVQWCAQLAADLGRPRVSNQAALRTLVQMLTDSPELADQVRDRISHQP